MFKAEVKVREVDGILVGDFWDCVRLDAAPVQDLIQRYSAHTKNGGRPDLVVDLSGVSSTGSAALGVMVKLQRECRSLGGRMVLSDLEPPVQEAFRASGLLPVFRILATRDEALKWLGEPGDDPRPSPEQAEPGPPPTGGTPAPARGTSPLSARRRRT